jgi:hypothetical protein
MFPPRVLAAALIACLPGICVNSEVPKLDDPPPFADIPVPEHTKSSPTDDGHAPSIGPVDPAALRRAEEAVRRVNLLGDPKLIDFRGVSEVPVEDVRSALRWDPKFQAASRPSNKASDFLPVLESRVLDGYQSSGFPDAKVSAWRDVVDHKFVVVVTEGERYRQGKIVVTGDDRIDRTKLVHWLTTKQSPRSWQIRYDKTLLSNPPDEGMVLWTPGKNLNFTPPVKATFEGGVRQALIEQGFPYASFELKFVPASEPSLSDLHVTLLEVGADCLIDEIEVHGLHRDTREQLLKFLGIKTGQKLSAALLAQIDRELVNSCRYWSHQVVVQLGDEPVGRYPSTGDSAKLILSLEEFKHAPPLHESLSEVDEILRKAARWINTSREGRSKFAVVCEGKVVDPEDPRLTMEFHPLAIAADGNVAANIKYTSATWAADHAVLITPQYAELIDWTRRERFSVACPLKPTIAIQLLPDHKEQGEYAHKLSIAYNLKRLDADSREQPCVDMHAEPVALVYLAHRPQIGAAIVDGKLNISADGVEIQFDAASGAVLQVVSCADLDGGSRLTMKFDSGDLAAAATSIRSRAHGIPNRFDPDHPLSSLVTFVFDQIRSQPCVAVSPELSAKCANVQEWLQHPVVAAPLNELDKHFVDFRLPATDDEVKFSIPCTLPTRADGMESLWDSIAQFGIAGADQLFQRGSWPWTVMREYSFDRFADGTADASPKANSELSAREFNRAFSGDELGPVSALAIVDRVRSLDPENANERARNNCYSALFVERGLSDLSDEAVLKDIRILTSNETEFSKLCCISASKYCALTDAQQTLLRDALPEPFRVVLNSLNTRHGANPKEPIDKSIERVLLRAHADDVAQKSELTK